MTPSPDQAGALADALDAVLARLEEAVTLDDLLRAVDLGDRLVAMEAPDHAELAQAWRDGRPAVVARLVARAGEPDTWAPLDEVGDRLLVGELPDEVAQWGMALLRVARALPLLPPALRGPAAGVVARGVDRIQLLPDRFRPLVGLAADRVEHEGAQPPAVQRLLDHMLELPLLLAEDAEAEEHPVRLDLMRRLCVIEGRPVVAPADGGGVRVFLGVRAAPLPKILAADDGARAEPPADAWVTAWHDDTASLSVAELAGEDGRSWLLLSVVLGPAAPAELALDQPGAVRLDDLAGQPAPARVERATDEEWRAWVEGTAPLVVRLAWRAEPVVLRFDRPEAPW